MDPSLFAESGELRYSLSHAYGSPLATRWHSDKFLNPSTDGAVLPVLQLNRYKINNPIILRISREKLIGLGYGYTPYSSTAIRSLCITRWWRPPEHCVLEPATDATHRPSDVALFAHRNIARVLVPRWIELPAAIAISCLLQAAVRALERGQMR